MPRFADNHTSVRLIACMEVAAFHLKLFLGEHFDNFWPPSLNSILVFNLYTPMTVRKHSQHLKFSQGETFLDHPAQSVSCTDFTQGAARVQGEPFLYKAGFSARMHTRERVLLTLNPEVDIILQSHRNKPMHSINGNTARSVVLLEYHIPLPTFQISRSTFLQMRTPTMIAHDSPNQPQDHTAVSPNPGSKIQAIQVGP